MIETVITPVINLIQYRSFQSSFTVITGTLFNDANRINFRCTAALKENTLVSLFS